VAHIAKKDTFIVGTDHNLENVVFKDFVPDVAVEIRKQGILTRETAENNDTVKQNAGS